MVIPLFLVSIIMISFSGIQKVTYNNGILEIEKLTEETQKDHSVDAVKQELVNKLAAIDTKRIKNTETIKTFEQAYTVIDEPKKAIILKKQLSIIKLK